MVKNIIHNVVFRIFTPLFYGVIMYVLILLIFDRVQELSENFLLVEAFLCISITYLLFEIMRWYLLKSEQICSLKCTINQRILIQVAGSLVISVLITSLIISLYFSKLVGFNTYRTELVVFNTIFLLTAILYNAVYLSFFYLNRINTTQMEKETLLRKNVEIELDTYKNKINPEFLYNSLETIISLSKTNVEKADRFILKLSEVYRSILSAKNSQLADVHEELKIAETFREILSYRFGNNLNLNIENGIKESSLKVISGTFVVVLEDIINRSVISDVQPLRVNCKLHNNFININHTAQNKLIPVLTKKTELKHLRKAYKQINREFEIIEKDHIRNYQIPLIIAENE